MHGSRIDLTGEVFGRLTVTEYAGNTKHNAATWRCKCSCGAEKVVSGNCLRAGRVRSCGCLQREVASETTAKRLTRHGMTRTPTYSSWRNMLTRCKNPNYKQAKDYSERGIAVCDRWLVFDNFLADMGSKPEGMTLERINNDKGYEPDNCKWATYQEQQINSRHNVHWKGRPVSEWAREMGMNYWTLYSRLKRNKLIGTDKDLS